MFGMCCMKRYWCGVRHRKERLPMWELEKRRRRSFSLWLVTYIARPDSRSARSCCL